MAIDAGGVVLNNRPETGKIEREQKNDYARKMGSI